MNRMMVALALATIAAVPAMAVQQGPTTKQTGVPHTVRGELTLFQQTNFNGEDWVIDTPSSVVHTDWNIRSIAVHPGDRWQICARPRFRDPCIILTRSVPDAAVIGVEGQIGSARPAPEPAAAPAGN